MILKSNSLVAQNSMDTHIHGATKELVKTKVLEDIE